MWLCSLDILLAWFSLSSFPWNFRLFVVWLKFFLGISVCNLVGMGFSEFAFRVSRVFLLVNAGRLRYGYLPMSIQDFQCPELLLCGLLALLQSLLSPCFRSLRMFPPSYVAPGVCISAALSNLARLCLC